MNTVGSVRCTVCRRKFVGDEYQEPDIRQKPADEWEEDSKVLKDLETRMEKAAQRISQIGPESIPPRGAIRLIVPNNPLGWVMVAIVVVALAATLAIVKILL